MNVFAKIIIASSVFLLPHLASACDKNCQQAKQEASFPKYVNQNYCRDLRDEFLSSTLRGVDTFIHNKLNIKYKGSIRNTRNYLSQNLEWVKECDAYTQINSGKRIFHDTSTTEKIYAMTQTVIKGFDSLLAGVIQVDENGEHNTIIKSDFNLLKSTVENHRDLMHVRGTYAFN